MRAEACPSDENKVGIDVEDVEQVGPDARNQCQCRSNMMVIQRVCYSAQWKRRVSCRKALTRRSSVTHAKVEQKGCRADAYGCESASVAQERPKAVKARHPGQPMR